MSKLFPRNALTSPLPVPTRTGGLPRPAMPSQSAGARCLDARHVATFLLAVVLLLLLVDPVHAQVAGGGAGGQGNITAFLQNLVNLITGTAGKLISVLAICIVGIGALMGALSIRAAGGVILGVMLIFSASWIVEQIVGGTI